MSRADEERRKKAANPNMLRAGDGRPLPLSSSFAFSRSASQGAMTRSQVTGAWIGPVAPVLVTFVGRRNTNVLSGNVITCVRRQSYHIGAPMASFSPPVGDSGKAQMPNKWTGEGMNTDLLISEVKFNDVGLVPAIAQQWDTGEVLMMAWMNAESIRETMQGGRAVYFSRSRKELWRKGDTSGQIQVLRDILLDCDGDTVLVQVDQLGVACHTGRRSCFYTAFRPPSGEAEIIADVLMDPKELYKTNES